MRHYIVIAAKAICAPQSEKLLKGTIKPESYFADGQIAELKGRGMIADYEPKAKATTPAAEPVAAEPVAAEPAAEPVAVSTAKPYSRMNLTELKDACVDKGIDFAPEATKAQLIALLGE